jgi:hypothetical protein
MDAVKPAAIDQHTLLASVGEAAPGATRSEPLGPAFASYLARAGVNSGQVAAATPQFAPAPNRWQSLRFLLNETSVTLPSFMLANLSDSSPAQPSTSPAQQPVTAWQKMSTPATPVVQPTATSIPVSVSSLAGSSTRSLDLAEYPQPANNNGRGIHWIPTTSSTPEAVDRFVAEAQRMGIRWVTFLNSGTQVGANDYLVKRLVESGIEPVLRVYTDAGQSIEGDLGAMVRHYRNLGVNYFQLFNEPNLRIENNGQTPSVSRYLDKWLPAAQTVVANGGLPGFGSLSPQGDVEDLAFLRESLQAVKARGAEDVLGRSWLSVHNYGTDYLRVREYDRIVSEELGRSLPQIGTEAGIYTGPQLNEQEQVRILSNAYGHMTQREPYYMAYTYWIIANGLGGGHDPAWEGQALFRSDGGVSPLVGILQGNA